MVQNYEQYIKKVGKLNRNSEVLSASIISSLNQVFYADDLSSPCVNARDLSVRYVTQEQFHKMVNGDPSVSAWFEPTTLYVVSSDEINAYNTNIKNVADPLEPKDAANKRYVDEEIERASISAAEAAVISAENACYIVSSLEDAPTEGNNIGDAAIVSAKIAGSDSLISRTSYYWNGNAWAAMDGNYTADNVYFEEDISCVGPWTSVGNISKGSTTAVSAIHSKGESLKTVLETIFMVDQDNATVSQPTFTAQLTSTTVGEVGTTITPKFKVTFSPGSYTYGSLAADGTTWVNGTGVTASILSATELSGTATLTSLASITLGTTYTSPSAVVVTDSAGLTFKVNAFVSYTKGNTVCTAAHKASTSKTPIAAGTKTTTVNLPAGYRKPFWGYILATETQPSTNTSEWTSSLIRGLRGNTATSTAGLPTSYNIPSNVTWIIFACAATGGKSNVVVIDDKSKQEQTFTKQLSAVNVEGANGYTAVPYNIFWKRFSSPTEAEMNLKMTWS